MQKIVKNIPLILILSWVLIWMLPWAIWLDSLPWVRLGISVAIFAIPGIALSLILVGKRLTILSHLTSGLALSVFFISSFSLLGRIFHIPFEFIKPVFALTGLIALLALIKHSRSEQQLYRPKNFSLVNSILLFASVIFGVIISLQTRFHADDFSYLAYLTNWQHAQPLDFKEVFFGSGNMDSIRFWLAMFPMDLAFLAEISHLHGLLLLGFYLGPFFVAIALLAAYNLYEDLFQSDQLAIAALLLQFTFLFLLRGGFQSGNYFFTRIAHDKLFAAFILAPVFFLSIRYFLQAFTLRSGIFSLLIGWGLALTHPVILAYSIFIAGLYTSIVTIMAKDYKKFAVVLALLMIIILPSASLRFVELPWISKYVFGLETALRQPGAFDLESASQTIKIQSRIAYINNTPFYGFPLQQIKIQINNKSLWGPLQALFSWSYVWILGLGFLWSLFNLKKNTLAPFVMATSSLILICVIPYTGWLMGYLVSARMLWRSPWLLPIGFIGIVLLVEFLKITLYRIPTSVRFKISNERITLSLVLVLCSIVIGYGYSLMPVYQSLGNSLTKLDDYKDSLARLSTLGTYLEKSIEKPSVFVARTELSDYLPGLSSKSKVIFFRSSNFTPQRVNMKQINRIFSKDKSIPITDRVNILNKYHIQYILIEDTSVKDYYASSPQFFRLQEVNGYWLIEIKDMKEGLN